MAQRGRKTITFDILANTADAQAKVEALSTKLEKVQGKDGKMHLKADVDMSDLNKMQDLIKNEKMKVSVETTGVKDLQEAMTIAKDLPDVNKALKKQFNSVNKLNLQGLTKNLQEAQKQIAKNGLGDLVQNFKKMKSQYDKNIMSGKEDWGLAEDLLRVSRALQALQTQAGKKIDLGEMLGLSNVDVNRTVSELTKSLGQIQGVGDILKKGNYSSVIDQLKLANKVISGIKGFSPIDIEKAFKLPVDKIDFTSMYKQMGVAQKEAQKTVSDQNVDVDSSGIVAAQKIVADLKADLQSIKDQQITIKLDVQPTVESIKADLKNIGDQQIDFKINLGKSLENIEKMSKVFNSKEMSSYMHRMTEVSAGFKTAFANLKDATRAPSSILDELNAKAKTLKNTLSSVGVTKFKDIDKVQKQIEEITTAQQKAADKAGDEMLNTLVKMEKDVVKQKAKVQAEAEKQAASYSEKEQADKSQKLYKTQLKNATKTLTQAKLMKDSITEIGGTREAVARGISELQSLMPKDGSIVKPEDIANIDMATAKLKELLVAKNQVYDTKNGTLAENSFFSDITKNLSEIDPNDIRKRLNDYYKSMGKEAEKIVQKNADTYQISYRDKDMMMRDTVQIQQFASGIDGANQYATALRTVTKAESEYMTSGQKWMTGFKNKMSNLTQYMTGADILYRTAQELREGFTFVKDLNSLMTTIDQTSDITGQGLQELSQGAIDQAKNLGVVAEQVTGSIEVYAAYGQTVDDLLNKASPTTMLAKASGADVSTASDQILGVNLWPQCTVMCI